MNDAPRSVGRRVLVIGLAGSGKSTFSRALSSRTALPVIHLDVHYWKPGWEKPSEDEWSDRVRGLLSGDSWIADGNYYEILDLELGCADAVVIIDTPWWLCAGRAFLRGLRKPQGEMPEGCEDSVARRIRDEWGIVYRVWRGRRSELERARSILSEHGAHVRLTVLRSKREAHDFLRAVVVE